MFDHLPLHIRESIFGRVRYVDLFETARVSQEWWVLSMASFERVFHKEDDFLLDQVDFCNEMMPKEEPWQWWMLMEFTKSKKIHLEVDDFRALINVGNGRLIKYFEDKEIHVQHFTFGKSSVFYEGFQTRLPSNLNQLFPNLISLELNQVLLGDSSTVALPSKLKSLALYGVRMQSKTSLTSMLSDASKLKVLHLTGPESGVYFDGQNCRNLTHLSVDVVLLKSDNPNEVPHTLRKILNQNKRLKNVSLQSAIINKEWLQIFPKHVVELELKKSHLSWDLIALFGENALYERMALIYLCEDWKSVTEFRTSEMMWHTNLEVVDEFGEDVFAANYAITYTCKPTANIEEIEVCSERQNFGFSDSILQNNQGLLLTTLKIGGNHFLFPVPPNVRNLNFSTWPYKHRGLLQFEDASVLDTLHLNQHHISVIDLDDLSNMVNLKKLELGKCDSRHLARILVACTSLVELKLEPSGCCLFKHIASRIQSVSLKRLTMLNGNDTFEDMLTHLPFLKTLHLELHSFAAILQSDVNTISHLLYFKAVFKRNKEIAVFMSSLQFPCMVFACGRRHDYYAASMGIDLMNEIFANASVNNQVNAQRSFILNTTYNYEKPSHVYIKNVPTRFLRNTCLVTQSINEFLKNA